MTGTRAALLLALALSVSSPASAQGKKLPQAGAMIGEVRIFAISETNRAALNILYAKGWLPADGRTLPKAQFRELSEALGTTWGKAQDSASFVLPDLRGVFLRGFSGANPRDPDAASRVASAPGGSTGNSVGSYEDDALQTHNHADAGHDHPLQQSDYTGRGGSPHGPYDQGGGPALSSGTGHAQIGGPLGARVSSESRPKNVAVYYFIYAGHVVPASLR